MRGASALSAHVDLGVDSIGQALTLALALAQLPTLAL